MALWVRAIGELILTSESLVERRLAPAFNVGVLLERQLKTLKSGFQTPVWSVAELLLRPEGEVGVRQSTEIENRSERKQVLWTGFALEFHRDGGESYWHTLVGEQQEIFVVCQDDEEDELAPILITADYDEAMAYHEADDTVLSAPMPQVIYQTLERFVLENYAPEQKKRRKRKQWHNADAAADEPFARHPDHR